MGCCWLIKMKKNGLNLRPEFWDSITTGSIFQKGTWRQRGGCEKGNTTSADCYRFKFFDFWLIFTILGCVFISSGK